MGSVTRNNFFFLVKKKPENRLVRSNISKFIRISEEGEAKTYEWIKITIIKMNYRLYLSLHLLCSITFKKCWYNFIKKNYHFNANQKLMIKIFFLLRLLAHSLKIQNIAWKLRAFIHDTRLHARTACNLTWKRRRREARFKWMTKRMWRAIN